MNRREFLQTTGVAAVGFAAGFGARELGDGEQRAAVLAVEHSPSPSPSASPTPTPAPSKEQRISGLVRSAGTTIPKDTRLVFDPAVSTTLEMSGNLIVEGIVDARPNAGVIHTIRFVGVDESRFVGGGSAPLDSDVGLWVVDAGLLNLNGRRTGNTITDVGESFTAGRSVRIEGTPQGRAHVWIKSSSAQRIVNVAGRWLGPATPTGNPDPSLASRIVPGRYGLHFHHCKDGSRGSLVQGVVLRDLNNRGFVPHASHGIQFIDCVAWRPRMQGFWWDPPDSDGTNQSDDILWDRCKAIGTFGTLNDFETFSGFTLGLGQRNTCRRCVSAGTNGWLDPTGFDWPRSGSDVWTAEDLTAHDNEQWGIFIWGNDPKTHPINRITLFNNGKGDINQNGYSNAYHYTGGDLRSPVGIHVRAAGRNPIDNQDRLTFELLTLAGRFEIAGQSIGARQNVLPTMIVTCTIEGGVLVDQSDGAEASLHEFVNCTRGGRGLVPQDFTVINQFAGSKITVRNADGSGFTIP